MKSPRSLTEGSISLGLLKFSLPILYATVLQSLNISVNSFWVGHYLGEAALAATLNANFMMFLLIGAAFGIAAAATILVGQFIGANNLHEAKRIVGTSATFFFAISVVIGATGLALSTPLLIALQTPLESLSLAVTYTRISFLALPSIYLYAFVTGVLRGAGDSKTPFHFMLLSVVLDIGLNPVFIFGIGPIPRLGIAGSPAATFVAQTVSLIALIRHLYHHHNPLCLYRDELRLLHLDRSIVGALVRKGIPMGAQTLVLSLSCVLMVFLVNPFGVETAAAFGAALQIWNYLAIPSISIGAAVSSMAAQNVGARKWDRVNSVVRLGVIYSVLLTGLIVFGVELLGAHAFEFFLPSGSAALQIAVHLNGIATWAFLFSAISMVLISAVSATGTVIAPLIVLVISFLIVRFSLAEVLLERYHADAVWWSFSISTALSAVLAVLYYKHGGWRGTQITVPPELS